MKAFLIILASVFMIFGILYLTGRDWLFSKKEKEEYNIMRLRLVWGIILILAAVDMYLTFSYLRVWGGMILALPALVGTIFKETWAKKKESDF